MSHLSKKRTGADNKTMASEAAITQAKEQKLDLRAGHVVDRLQVDKI